MIQKKRKYTENNQEYWIWKKRKLEDWRYGGKDNRERCIGKIKEGMRGRKGRGQYEKCQEMKNDKEEIKNGKKRQEEKKYTNTGKGKENIRKYVKKKKRRQIRGEKMK